MKNKAIVSAVAVLFQLLALGAVSSAWATDSSGGPAAGSFGIGIEAGQPSGATAKYWIDPNSAVAAGVGESNGNATLHTDLIWHAWDVLPQPQSGKLGLYFGAGPRLEFASDTEFAIRTFVGLSYWLENHPVEIFAEVGPAFQLTQGGDTYADGAVGARFYFDWHAAGR